MEPVIGGAQGLTFVCTSVVVVVAVSYTHLDVYKRQALENTSIHTNMCFTPRFDRGIGPRKSTVISSPSVCSAFLHMCVNSVLNFTLSYSYILTFASNLP